MMVGGFVFGLQELAWPAAAARAAKLKVYTIQKLGFSPMSSPEG